MSLLFLGLNMNKYVFGVLNGKRFLNQCSLSGKNKKNSFSVHQHKLCPCPGPYLRGAWTTAELLPSPGFRQLLLDRSESAPTTSRWLLLRAEGKLGAARSHPVISHGQRHGLRRHGRAISAAVGPQLRECDPNSSPVPAGFKSPR